MKYKVGDSASFTKMILDEDVKTFAIVSGDNNPIHLDEEVASKSVFKKRVAHGILVASYISKVLGTMLPGEGSIYLNQTLNFKKPVYLGDEVTVKVTIKQIDERKVTLLTICFNKTNDIVIDGEAILLIPHEKIGDDRNV